MGAGAAKQAVYCVSDIHTDHKANWAIILKLAEQKHVLNEVSPQLSPHMMAPFRPYAANSLAQATLICAGDISMDLDTLTETLTFLKSVFAHVFFCPVRADANDSKVPRLILTLRAASCTGKQRATPQ